MKLKLFIAFIFMGSSQASICNAQAKEPNFNIDSNHYSIDTSINKLLINKKYFSVEIFRKKVINENKNEKELALLVRNATNNKIEYFKNFDENGYNVSFVDGKLFLELLSHGGGSGFTGNCFEVIYQNKRIEFIPVYHFDELTLVHFSSANEIIILQAIYNYKEDETHFSDHRFAVVKYNYVDGKFKETKLGNTKFKYSGFGEHDSVEKVMLEIIWKEGVIRSKIN